MTTPVGRDTNTSRPFTITNTNTISCCLGLSWNPSLSPAWEIAEIISQSVHIFTAISSVLLVIINTSWATHVTAAIWLDLPHFQWSSSAGASLLNQCYDIFAIAHSISMLKCDMLPEPSSLCVILEQVTLSTAHATVNLCCSWGSGNTATSIDSEPIMTPSELNKLQEWLILQLMTFMAEGCVVSAPDSSRARVWYLA